MHETKTEGTQTMTAFLTGATGFVGGEVLRRLAREGRRVVCLVRAGSQAAGVERGRATLAALGIDPRAPIEWVAGDVERPCLGLEPTHLRALGSRIDEVFHCAASTDFDLPLDEALRVNVVGTRHVCELALASHRAGRLRRFVHVSTAYASGYAGGRAVSADELPADDSRRFRNNYERTKAMAERELRELSAKTGLPLTVLRPSIIVGDSRTGWTSNWNVMYFPMRMIAWRKSPFIPVGGLGLLDCVPVDFVADAVLALGRSPATLGRTLHVTAGDEVTTVQEVFDRTARETLRRDGPGAEPIKTRLLGSFLFMLVVLVIRLFGSAALRKNLANLSSYVGYTRVSSTFDVTRETALLAADGLSCPKRTEFLPRVIEYALVHNFGKPLPGARVRTVTAPRRASARLAAALQSASGTIADALRKPGVSGAQAANGVPA